MRVCVSFAGLREREVENDTERERERTWAFNVCIYGREIIIINPHFDSFWRGFIKILQLFGKLLDNVRRKILISSLHHGRKLN